MRILIANRGEIARRVIRTAHGLGHETVAVFADPDIASPHVAEATVAVRIGPAALAESYLSVDALLAAAAETGATAVHPGYGFLSENAGFARAVLDAGLIWIGPSPEVIEQMGSKIDARRLAVDAGVPVIPGFDTSQDPADLAAAAARIGFPVLIKAAAGGGGKGIRIVHTADGFAAALAEATAEGRNSFGDDAVIVERYIQRPRHVEVQVVGDRHGHVIHLGTRECSVQRRYQKVLEEAPAPNLPDDSRRRLHDAAVALADAVGYDSTGTVEFVVDDETGEPYFLEMNTRLQVEHPVTELVTGLDLVELQLRVAAGAPLGLEQDEIRWRGHAFEARINAENPAEGFRPELGTVEFLRVPKGVRWDAAVERGSEITPFYDSMIAKLIVHGTDREQARRRLADALGGLVLGGLVTNVGFHRWLIDTDPVIAGRVTTRFLDETEIPAAPALEHAAAAATLRRADRRSGPPWERAATGPWQHLGARRFTPHRPSVATTVIGPDGVAVEVSAAEVDAAPCRHDAIVDRVGRRVAFAVDGHTQWFRIPPRSEAWIPDDAAAVGSGSAVTSPFPASVAEVHVAPGDAVVAGDPLLVVEAMKMLHTLAADGAAVIDEVRVAPGDQVTGDQVLVTFADE